MHHCRLLPGQAQQEMNDSRGGNTFNLRVVMRPGSFIDCAGEHRSVFLPQRDHLVQLQ